MTLRIPAVALLCLALGLGGICVSCGPIKDAVNWAFGISTDPNTGEPKSDGSGGPAGSVLNLLIPGAGTALGFAVAAYTNAKRRQWKAAAVSSFKAVEEFAQTEPGKPVAAKLKEKLGEKHAAAKVWALVNAVLDKEKINKPAPTQ